jgi:hypothetical protein
MITPRDFPIRPARELDHLPRSGELGSHNWYPAVQRCACGLNLRSAQLWTDHIAAVAGDRAALPPRG